MWICTKGMHAQNFSIRPMKWNEIVEDRSAIACLPLALSICRWKIARAPMRSILSKCERRICTSSAESNSWQSSPVTCKGQTRRASRWLAQTERTTVNTIQLKWKGLNESAASKTIQQATGSLSQQLVWAAQRSALVREVVTRMQTSNLTLLNRSRKDYNPNSFVTLHHHDRTHQATYSHASNHTTEDADFGWSRIAKSATLTGQEIDDLAPLLVSNLRRQRPALRGLLLRAGQGEGEKHSIHFVCPPDARFSWGGGGMQTVARGKGAPEVGVGGARTFSTCGTSPP